VLQDCLSLGKPMLIENVEEELDPVLDPVLDRRIIRKGKSMTIALADKEASHLPSARLLYWGWLTLTTSCVGQKVHRES